MVHLVVVANRPTLAPFQSQKSKLDQLIHLCLPFFWAFQNQTNLFTYAYISFRLLKIVSLQSLLLFLIVSKVFSNLNNKEEL
jgi:hypothetical protein